MPTIHRGRESSTPRQRETPAAEQAANIQARQPVAPPPAEEAAAKREPQGIGLLRRLRQQMVEEVTAEVLRRLEEELGRDPGPEREPINHHEEEEEEEE